MGKPGQRSRGASSRDRTAGTAAERRPVVAPLAEAGLRATTNRVQEMHQAIAATTFGVLETVPLLALPSRLMQGAHDAISDAVYAGVRHGGAALSTLTAGVERVSDGPPSEHRVLRNALNAAFGDRLEAVVHPLAVGMQLLVDGHDILNEPQALRSLGARVVLFVHGLGCDERSWSRPHPAWDAVPGGARGTSYAELLRRDEGVDAVFLRYNTGLSIDDNAARLGGLLARLLEAAPQIERLALVGHSMGGLVARSACEQGWARGDAWVKSAALIVCVGSPNQGAPLEQLGRLTSAALSVSSITQPIATMAEARSRGIRDLGDGLKRRPVHAPIPLRFISANLADASHGPAAALVGQVLGDGLVTPHSAADTGLGGDVERVELQGLGHMALLHHPRVYDLLRQWIHGAFRAD